jgi:23S rRNA (uracil1939-C5)-methyltransferase
MTEKLVEIKELGSSGDGIFVENEQNHYVPFSLQGEKIIVKPSENKRKPNHYDIVEIKEKSESRIDAFCKYFGECGGCNTQHIERKEYTEWKVNILRVALKQNHLKDYKLKPMEIVEPGTRRRISISYENYKGHVELGFNMKSSRMIVEIDSCPLLNDGLNKILPELKTLLEKVTTPRDGGHLMVTYCDTGLDISFCPKRKPKFSPETLEIFAEFAHANNISQITRAGKETIITRQDPEIKFGDSYVKFPSNAFLQPSKKGEEIMMNIVRKVIESVEIKKPKTLDLCCGLGTFSLPLTQYGKVTAADVFGPSIRNLKELNNVNLEVIEKDLFRDPYLEKELNEFDLIVINPPRCGAVEQIEQIAKSKASKIVYISCHPGSFARDARILVDAGFTLKEVTPVDQFFATSHLEVAAVLTR